MIGTSDTDDKVSRINSHSMVGFASFSLAKSANVYAIRRDSMEFRDITNTRRENTHKNLKTYFITYKIRKMM